MFSFMRLYRATQYFSFVNILVKLLLLSELNIFEQLVIFLSMYYLSFKNTTLTSQELFKSQATRLIVQQHFMVNNAKSPKLHITGSVKGAASPGDFSLTKGKDSHAMASWC